MRNMGWYSVNDCTRKQTTWVYNLPSADFESIYEMLKAFSAENNLTDALVAVRKYDDAERREDGTSVIEESFEALPDAEKAKKRKPKTRPVKAEEGPCLVDSFEWNVRELDGLKFINYLFYDDGWPGRCVVSKRNSALEPTEIVFSCCDRDSKLGEKFKQALSAADIPPEPSCRAKL